MKPDAPVRLRLLGTAAGGGVPQWNCTCRNCESARAGRISRRTQSSVAAGDAETGWFLINASPDLPAQIEGLPRAAKAPGGLRGSPIRSVLLTNADLDHVLGLFTLREGGPLRLYATKAVRQTLTDGLRIESVLGAFCPVEWHEVTDAWQPLPLGDAASTHLHFRAIFLPGTPPPYARGMEAPEIGHSVACEIRDERGDRRAVIAPDVGETTPELAAALAQADVVLFDGTFWDDDELRTVRPGARTSREMGHLPISAGSLELLGPMAAGFKGYIHINNTNPILNPHSAERAAVQAAGLAVCEDGAELLL